MGSWGWAYGGFGSGRGAVGWRAGRRWELCERAAQGILRAERAPGDLGQWCGIWEGEDARFTRTKRPAADWNRKGREIERSAAGEEKIGGGLRERKEQRRRLSGFGIWVEKRV